MVVILFLLNVAGGTPYIVAEYDSMEACKSTIERTYSSYQVILTCVPVDMEYLRKLG